MQIGVRRLLLPGMWLWYFFGLGFSVMRGIGEQEWSKYILNSTAQRSISE